MALQNNDYYEILRGFTARFQMQEKQKVLTNPIKLVVPVDGHPKSFRLWAFEITHGGGGPLVRAANEYRVQVTKGPMTVAEFDNGVIDILLGYSKDKGAIVAYDRRWLKHYTQKKEEDPTARFSPSVQVKTEQINEGLTKGIYAFEKSTRMFGKADIITMTPEKLPDFLMSYRAYLTHF
ncbi:TPA: hypothetical protein ACOJPH_004445 [Vibrio campbellii]|uniref:hypothetical protein n=1 Tax=Vibrio campbellii TaxID=680 RepID=UPI0015B4FF59|nr:hypothetical protein [Vibrio parahaemolyticus]